MTAAAPSVTVVICTYTDDRWEDLAAAIGAVRMQTLPADEIVIVVDHAPELYSRAFAAYFGGDVRVVENLRDRGLSGARNTGIASSGGEIVVFLDDDAVPAPDWLERLIGPYQSEDVVAVGGRVVPAWDEQRPRWFPPEFDWVVGCTYAGHRTTAGEVRNLIGANMSFRRSTLDAIGDFRVGIGRDANAPTGCEETELCIRARQHDPRARIWYAPDAVVAHRVPATRGTMRYFRARCAAEGVSKARISRFVGSTDGLASERSYVTRALPRAIARDARSRRLGRVGAVMTGLAAAATGHARERMVSRSARPPFEPALVAQVELEEPMRDLSDVDPRTGRVYRRAFVLVRQGGVPVGTARVDLAPGGCPADVLEQELAAQVPAARVDAVFARGREPWTPPVSVVIATRDRPEQLEACLRSVFACEYPEFDVVVVDSAPASDATRALVEKLAETRPGLRYVREDLPGLARAHNAALGATDAPILAFTDDDVVVDPKWLAMLVRGFTATNRVGCVTGMIAPLELESDVQELIERATGFGKGVAPRVFDMEHPPEDALFPYTAGSFGSGANMAFTRAALDAMDGFDAALGAGTRAKGGDDLAAFFDVLQHGFCLTYMPGAIVFHRHRADLEGLRRQAFGYGVGLGAFLTKTVVDRPGRLVEIGSRLPRGVAHLVHPASPKNARVPDEYPRRLRYVERAGVLMGPALYVASRIGTRRRTSPATAEA